MNEKSRRERGSGRIWRIGRIWWVQFYHHGNQVRESSRSDKEADAKRLLRDRLSEVNQRVYHPSRRVTYEEIRDAFIADYVTKRRKSLRRDGEGKPLPLDKVQRLDDYFAGFYVEDIDSDALAKFTTELQAKGKKDSTINRSLSALRRMFRLARKQGKLKDMPPFEMLPESKPRQGFFEREQYETLSAALPDYLRLPLALGYFTAMRRAEILSLKWEQVDFMGRLIRLRSGETKNDEGREIPIVGELGALLREQHARRQPGCELVCFRRNRTGNAIPIGDFRKVWHSRCVKLRLGRMEGAKYVGIIFHDLRRTGVRNLVRAGVPGRIAMAVTGHKTRSVFERYNIVSGRDIEDAGRKLETCLAKNGAKTGQVWQGDSTPVGLTN